MMVKNILCLHSEKPEGSNFGFFIFRSNELLASLVKYILYFFFSVVKLFTAPSSVDSTMKVPTHYLAIYP